MGTLNNIGPDDFDTLKYWLYFILRLNESDKLYHIHINMSLNKSDTI
jgi:hypothetical protein